jgi:hypothetical protein
MCIVPLVVNSTSAPAENHQNATGNVIPEFTSDLREPPTTSQAPEADYVVKRIRKRRLRNGEYEYLVRWEGYGREHDSWEPRSMFNGNIADRYDERLAPSTRRQTRSRRFV